MGKCAEYEPSQPVHVPESAVVTLAVKTDRKRRACEQMVNRLQAGVRELIVQMDESVHDNTCRLNGGENGLQESDTCPCPQKKNKCVQTKSCVVFEKWENRSDLSDDSISSMKIMINGKKNNYAPDCDHPFWNFFRAHRKKRCSQGRKALSTTRLAKVWCSLPLACKRKFQNHSRKYQLNKSIPSKDLTFLLSPSSSCKRRNQSIQTTSCAVANGERRLKNKDVEDRPEDVESSFSNDPIDCSGPKKRKLVTSHCLKNKRIQTNENCDEGVQCLTLPTCHKNACVQTGCRVKKNKVVQTTSCAMLETLDDELSVLLSELSSWDIKKDDSDISPVPEVWKVVIPCNQKNKYVQTLDEFVMEEDNTEDRMPFKRCSKKLSPRCSRMFRQRSHPFWNFLRAHRKRSGCEGSQPLSRIKLAKIWCSLPPKCKSKFERKQHKIRCQRIKRKKPFLSRIFSLVMGSSTTTCRKRNLRCKSRILR